MLEEVCVFSLMTAMEHSVLVPGGVFSSFYHRLRFLVKLLVQGVGIYVVLLLLELASRDIVAFPDDVAACYISLRKIGKKYKFLARFGVRQKM